MDAGAPQFFDATAFANEGFEPFLAGFSAP